MSQNSDSMADKPTVLFYSCSGGANVAEIADRTARELMFDHKGTMFCLAGLGAGIEEMLQTARDADLNVVIDGCSMNCAKRIFDNNEISNYVQINVTDLGIEKIKGQRATDEQIQEVIKKVDSVVLDILTGRKPDGEC